MPKRTGDAIDIPEGLEHLLPRFLAELEADARSLEALADAERGALADHAHAMRGKCAMFGAAGMAEALGRLEESATNAEREEIRRKIAKIVGRIRQLAIYNESIDHGVPVAIP